MVGLVSFTYESAIDVKVNVPPEPGLVGVRVAVVVGVRVGVLVGALGSVVVAVGVLVGVFVGVRVIVAVGVNEGVTVGPFCVSITSCGGFAPWRLEKLIAVVLDVVSARLKEPFPVM